MLENALDTGFRILYANYAELDHWKMDNLSAPYWRLYWAREKGGWVKDIRGTHPLDPDCMYLLSPDTQCSGGNTQTFHKLFIHFVLGLRYDVAPRRLIRIPCTHEKIEEARRCAESFESDSPAGILIGMQATAIVNWALCQLPSDALVVGSSNSRVDEAIELFHRSFPRPVSNDQLAASVHMNTNAFIRLFRETTGETPQTYYTRLRIERACQMLHFRDDSIEEIAEATGFCDRYHFSRVFKKLRGIGPAGFRKQREGQEI